MLKSRGVYSEDSFKVVVATLSRLGTIAAENAVYVDKMKKRFRMMNIVGEEEEKRDSYFCFRFLIV